MIASLRGTVLHLGLDHVVIECGGVGHRVLVAPSTTAGVQRGCEASLLTTLIVREDSLTLYGFHEAEMQELFTLIQTVSGVGPKLAMAALSVLEPHEIKRACADSDVRTLCRIPGVGKRVAERIIVELRDKVTLEAPDSVSPSSVTTVAQQLLDALEGLGFSVKQAEPIVNDVVASADNTETSHLLREALKQLGKS